uniref:Small nuclear RNA activating complex, polypeptide 4 n=1 Tax=Salmo trutta TaxID=8032 RepID=A0A673XXV4_SALTR
IEELECTLGPNASNTEIMSGSHCPCLSKEDSAEELDLPQNTDTCLQMNLVYQEVLKEKLEELEQLLSANQHQQKEIMTQLSGTGTPQATTSGQPTLKLFLGSFLKPYFRDKVTFLGPPANPEAREKMSKRIGPTDDVKMKRWEGWQKTLLINAVMKDSMKRMIQPKLSKVEYLTQKMVNAENVEKQILRKQVTEIEKDIEAISALKEDELMGGRYDDHDWQKISNIDFEGIREAEHIKSFWQNYLHPSINKSSWKENEIEMLKKVAVKHGHRNWDQIADKLGTNRTAFMCLQTYQRYICTDFRRRRWGGVEDEILRELVEKMRIGNYIPYTQISYFMEGRDSCQLMYRWTQVLDPTLKKGYWSKEEDEMLLRAVAKHGVGNWWKIRQDVPGRNDGQCRDRYVDVLVGNVKKGPFDEKEKAQLRRLVEKYGRKWSKIAAEIPNRIDCQVLQQWRRMTGYKVSVDYVAFMSLLTSLGEVGRNRPTLFNTSLKNPKQRHGPRTVASMLNQKGNEQQNSKQQNSQLVMMIPQTFVIAPPVVQSIPHPAVPSTPTSRQQLMLSTLTQLRPSTPTQLRPSTPSRPILSTPSLLIPSTPGQPVLSTPSLPIPSTPGQPVLSTPSLPIPSTPGQLVLSTPSLPIPSTPGQPVLSTPSLPIPSTPGQLIPSTPNRPILPAPLSLSIQSSTTIDRVNEEANENHSGKKRNRKPTEKAQALKDAAIAKKSVEESPKRKKARTKESLVVQPNVVVSPPQTAWVLTPIGLVPISGIGIQMTPQNLPRNALAPACPSPIIINQQVPLTLNAAATQASPNMTYVCPSPSTPKDPSALMVSPASSVAQGTASPSVLTSLSTSITITSNTALRMTNPVKRMRISNPVMQTVATTCPQLNAVSPVPMNTVISAPIRPQTGRPQASVLNVPPGSLPASFPQGALRIVQLNHPKSVPPPRNPELMQFDPNLMFMEDPAQVREWLSGKRGVSLPDLDVTLPYLPPFVSSLNTLSGLLKCKKTLAVRAMQLLPPEEKENQEEQKQVAAVRSFVAERFSHNPGYLLLKARFLSCFTMPALLATINPVKLSKSPTPDHGDVEEEPFRNRPKRGHSLPADGKSQVALHYFCLVHKLMLLLL